MESLPPASQTMRKNPADFLPGPLSLLAGRYGPWADVVDPDELVEHREASDRQSANAFGPRHRRIGSATRAILLRTTRL
jgi:hypothetical protein